VIVTWVIVADAARARFFQLGVDGNGARTLEEFDVMVSPRGRLHEGDLTADRPGRAFDSRGRGRHAMEPAHTAKEHEAQEFARELAAHVEDARIAGFVDKLVLIAPPRFLGQLRSSLCAQALELVVHSIDKELSTASCEEVASHLPRFFDR
jgi:protein required for attachment to host cells